MAAGAGSRHGVRWAVSAHSLLCSRAVSRVLFFETPPTTARQAPLSVGSPDKSTAVSSSRSSVYRGSVTALIVHGGSTVGSTCGILRELKLKS